MFVMRKLVLTVMMLFNEILAQSTLSEGSIKASDVADHLLDLKQSLDGGVQTLNQQINELKEKMERMLAERMSSNSACPTNIMPSGSLH